MRRLLQSNFGLVKFAAVGIAVFFAGSAATTYAGNRLLLEYGVEAGADDDEDEKKEDGEDTPPGFEDGEPTLASAARSNPRSTLGSSTKLRYKQATGDKIVEGNPFCPTCSPADEAAPEALASGARPLGTGEVRSSLPLQLLATMESDDPAWSMATIRDLDSNSLGPYVANEAVRPGVTIFAVERGKVILLNQGRREYISLGAEPAKPKPAPVQSTRKATKAKSSKGKSVAIAGAEQAIDCSSANSCTVDRKFVESLLANPKQLMSQARMYPVRRDGEPAGFKVSRIQSGSLATLIGLQNGDVLSEINGQKLGSIDDAMGMYMKLRRASHLSVVVERGGAVITKEISIK